MADEQTMTLAGILGVEDAPPALDEPEAPPAEEGTAGEPEAEQAPEPQEPEGEPERPAGAPAKWSLEEIGKVAEWTPELLADAAAWMRAEERRNQTIMARAAKQDRKAKQRIARQESERRSWDVARDQMIADAQALRNGSPQQRLDALARVTGLSADEVIEQITLGVAGDPAKKRPADPELAARLERLERSLQEREQTEQARAVEATVLEQLTQGVQDSERFPALAEVAREMGPAEAARRLLAEMKKRAGAGQVLRTGDMLALADRAQARSGRPTAAAAPVTATKPATQSSPSGKRPARTVPARLADTPSASTRAETESERLDRLAAMLGI